MLRTLLLRERRPAECRLSADDVAFLLAEHRGHVEVAPTGRRGRYVLTPLGYVGTIVTPRCRLVIRPKLPLRNLFHLLDPAGPLPFAEDQIAPAPGIEALDFLAGRLAQLLTERAAAGLHRGYVERAAQGPFLQGRLDLPAQVRAAQGTKERLHSRFEEFTADVPCNQVAKATAELVRRSPLLGDPVRQALSQALRPFEAVSPAALGPESFAAASPDRLTEAYRPLLDLCRLLADALGPGAAAGDTACPSFLIDMERVFESYVTDAVARAFAPGTVAAQPLHRVNRPVAGQPDIEMRPDVVVSRAGRSVLVVDAKWKVLLGSPLVVEDVYQVLAYAAALGAARAVLVYPGRRDRVWRYPLRNASLRIEVRTLRVVGMREECERSRRRLGRRLASGEDEG